MGTLNSRGHEVLDQTPIEIPLADMKRTPTIFERMQAMILQAKKDAEEVIQDEADLAEDLNDFSYENEADLFTGDSPYIVPDEVPDRVSAQEIREQKVKEQLEKNAPKTEPEPTPKTE